MREKPQFIMDFPYLLGIILPEFGLQIMRLVGETEHQKFKFIENSTDSKLGSSANHEFSLTNFVRIMPSRVIKHAANHWPFDELSL